VTAELERRGGGHQDGSHQGGLVVRTGLLEHALELEAMVNNLLQEKDDYEKACKAAGDYVHDKKGATKKIMTYIQAKRLLTN